MIIKDVGVMNVFLFLPVINISLVFGGATHTYIDIKTSQAVLLYFCMYVVHLRDFKQN